MEWKFSKNEKVNKVILMVLFGVMLLIILMPMKQMGNQSLDRSDYGIGPDLKQEKEVEGQNKSNEDRLKEMLEATYGIGTVKVMIYETKASSGDYYSSKQVPGDIAGVLIVISKNVVKETTVADITLAVCALFNLPAHKVSVLVKN